MMTTSLTREKLIGHATPRTEQVEVEGFGVVYLKSISNVQQSRREVQYTRDPDAYDLALAHQIIDQVTNEDGTPMFREDDAEMLSDLDALSLSPLYNAIHRFNDQKKVSPPGESTDT